MTTFGGTTHVDNLDEYYKLLRAMLLDPGWREDDFRRVKDDAINSLRWACAATTTRNSARKSCTRTLSGHAVRALNWGRFQSLEKITLDDLKAFYKQPVHAVEPDSRARGRLPAGFPGRDEEGLRGAAGEGADDSAAPSTPAADRASRMSIVDKNTRAVAFSLGFPIECHARRSGLCGAAAGVESIWASTA